MIRHHENTNIEFFNQLLKRYLRKNYLQMGTLTRKISFSRRRY